MVFPHLVIILRIRRWGAWIGRCKLLKHTETWDVVGPVCESGDFLAKDRHLPRLATGDLLATFSAGAYGMVMASNYNTRPRAPEVLVSGETVQLVRRRETFEDLIEPELIALN